MKKTETITSTLEYEACDYCGEALPKIPSNYGAHWEVKIIDDKYIHSQCVDVIVRKELDEKTK